MTLIIREMTIDHEEYDDPYLFDGKDFKLGKRGLSNIVIDITDTEKFQEIRLTIAGQVVQEDHRPMLPYERNQHFDDREDLKKALAASQKQVTALHMEMKELRDKQGIAVEAGKDDKMVIVGAEFAGSLEFALSEAGLKTEEVSEDVSRVVADTDEEEDNAVMVYCNGHQFQQHNPCLMTDYGTELQCDVCGNTRRRP